jgi:hypothetical protein
MNQVRLICLGFVVACGLQRFFCVVHGSGKIAKLSIDSSEFEIGFGGGVVGGFVRFPVCVLREFVFMF